MLDEHSQQLGEDLAQHTPRLGATRLIKDAVALPELKEQLNLPAGTGHDKGLGHGEQLRRGCGDEDGPLGPGQLCRTGGAAPPLRVAVQTTAAQSADVRGDAHAEQTRGKVLGNAQADGQIDGGGALRRQQSEHITPLALGGEDRRGREEAGEPVDTLGAHLGKDIQGEEAQISHPQRAGRQRRSLQRTGAFMRAPIGQQRATLACPGTGQSGPAA